MKSARELVRSRTALSILLVLGLQACANGCGETKTAVPEQPAATAQSKSSSTSGAVAGARTQLPPADRLFSVDLADGPLLLGSHGTRLWAVALSTATSTTAGTGKVRWTVDGDAMVQQVTVGDLGDGQRIYVARGRGRGYLSAPIVVEEIAPKTGARKELWRQSSPRADVCHLSVADVDNDGQPELAVAHFSGKYMVRTRHMKLDGSFIEGAETRMATERAFADLDGDGKIDEVVGRMYGDAVGVDGDLSINLGHRQLKVPTDRGIRSLVVGQATGDDRPMLYFADGWSDRYAAEGKAQLKRARFAGQELIVEKLGSSADEYTFNRLQIGRFGTTRGLMAWGSSALAFFSPRDDLPWPRRELRQDPQAITSAWIAGTERVYAPTTKGVTFYSLGMEQ